MMVIKFLPLNEASGKSSHISVHLSDFPEASDVFIDKDLEERMKKAQDISSMALALRKKSKIKVRQPLQKILIPILNEKDKAQIEKVSELIKSELNIKEIEFVEDASGILVKSIKPNFSVLGKKLGPKMKAVSSIINNWGENEIIEIEKNGSISIPIDGEEISIGQEEVVISTEDIPGWLVNSMDGLTVALDVTVTPELENEGTARELVNRVQNARKDKNFEIGGKSRKWNGNRGK